MNYATLKALVLENAGPTLHVGAPQLGRIVNRAVEHIVNLVELRAKLYNGQFCTPITVTVVSGTDEYLLNAASADGPPTIVIRKILHAERTDTSAARPLDCVLIDFRQKNRFSGSSIWPDGAARSTRPTIWFTRDNIGIWRMGFPYDPSGSMSIDVYYAPPITELSADTDVPREVPEHHHELIAVRATKVAMDQARLDSRPWDRQYVELRQTMEADLESWNRTGPRIRRFVG